MAEPIAVSRRIEAPAAAIFAILADPARHPEIDGSRMLTEPVDPKPLTKAGDSFVMRMSNKLIGDYTMTNDVTEFEQDRRITWEPWMSEVSRPEFQAEVGVRPSVRWTYDLAPDGEDATLVTETYDCSRAPEPVRERVRDGQIWRNGMNRSLDSLERLTAGVR